jgi:lysophospholipid acyltransferase (LPLAT)-like uncharacterized protein
MASLRRFTRSQWVQRATGIAAAHYLRFVWKTTRFSVEPADVYDRIHQYAPLILAFWHGQHFLTPFIRPDDMQAKVLISRHRDGEINAVAVERLGVEAIRGSGTHSSDFATKGGLFGLTELIRALEEGFNVAMTADVPKVARVAGLGIVKLAQVSGRPIYPIALATRQRIVFNNWDKTTLNLPFSRGVGVAGAPIYVPRDADDATLELARRAVEESLNALTVRAYEIVDGTAEGDAHG